MPKNTTCRGCGSQKNNFTLILNLGEQPWCNDFLSKENLGNEKKYPLNLVHCDECGLLQLDYTVPKEVMFRDHKYFSGMTKTLTKHFYEVAEENVKQFNIKENDLIVDIGGNDGCQLNQYKKLGLNNLLNFESAIAVSEISRQNGINTITEFFNETNALKYIKEDSVKLYNASGVFFHLEELHSVIKGIKKTLNKNGVLIVQFMYAGAMIDGKNFDTIYHEHLCYYTVQSLKNLLKPYNLSIFDGYYSTIHSGSIIAKICHSDSKINVKTDRIKLLEEKDKEYTLNAFLKFADEVQNKKNELRTFLLQLKAEGKKIYVYGAPAKGSTLLNYFGINKFIVDKAVEINQHKIGYYLPQSHIPIVEESKDDIPDYYLLLSHNFAEEIIQKNKDLIQQGVKFIIPFPTIQVISK
jgi:hypothetical protein